MKRLRNLWAWSWVATVPICLFWGVWLVRTFGNHRVFGVRFDATPLSYALWETGRDEFRHLLRRAHLALFPDGLRGREHADDLRTIHLFVPEKRIAQLDSNLPASGFEYVEGGLWDGRRVLEAKVRYRGDFARHWAWTKKSWRVKTDKDTLFEGLRSFNLIVPKFPEHLNNYLAYRLAQRMGLLAPRVELVHVAINGERSGVHLLCEQLGEMTLRSAGRMPGDIYSGDLVANNRFRGISNNVFEHAGLWEKSAFNNHYPEDHRAPLDRLIDLANAYPSERVQAELPRLLDMEAWARFSAFETLARTAHYDEGHNWRLYYDSSRGLFEPVVWDPVGWARLRMRREVKSDLDVVHTRLASLLFMNGDFLRARHAVLRDFFESGERDDFLEEAGRAFARTRAALAIDPNIRPIDMDRIDYEMEASRTSMERSIELIGQTFTAPSGRVQYAALPKGAGLALSVSGRRPVDRLVVHYDQPLTHLTSAVVRVLREGEPVDTDVLGALRVDGHRLEAELGLLSKVGRLWSTSFNALTHQHLDLQGGYYELRVEGLPGGAEPIEVLADRGGATLERAERVRRVRASDIGALYRVVPERPSYDPLLWSGEVRVTGVLEIERDLVIEPGTDVLMDPGASLIVRGRLLARGEPDRPIRFRPYDERAEPWGAVVVQGRESEGSRLLHCSFALGSGLKDDLREYSAMLSVHDTDAVLVESCSFRDSRVVDDMVHAVYAGVELVDCTFEGALSDAVDLDLCRAAVRNCVFRGSGNDALDLMGSKVVVVDCLMEENGDKGISVGERSTLLAINNRLVGNQIGVQAKDGSLAAIYNTDFEGNGLALDAYKKNWRYGDGGHLVVHKSRMESNGEGVRADKHSTVLVVDTFFDGAGEALPAGRGVVFHESVDALDRESARDEERPELLPEMAELLGLATAMKSRILPAVRGARLDGG